MPESKDKIRMEMYKTPLLSSDEAGEGVHVVEFTTFNLKGWVPGQIINMIMSNMIKGVMKDFHGRLWEF